MKISDKLKKLRKSRNLTQEHVALKINVSRKTISSWENDRSLPDINTLKNLAKLYDVPLSYLVGEVKSTNYHILDKLIIILYYLNFIFFILSILSTINVFFNFAFPIETIIIVTFISLYIYKYNEFKSVGKFPISLLLSLIVLLSVFQINKLHNAGFIIDLFTIIGATIKAFIITFGFRIILTIKKIKF